MKTPKEKFMNDPEYHYLVKTLESFIERAYFTPSEIREACTFACINYEMRHVRDFYIDPRVEDAFKTIDLWMDKPRRK